MREKLSKTRALLKAAAGAETGFFAQYAYMDSVTPVREYPAILRACEAGKPDDLLAVLEAEKETIAADPFWREGTSHLGGVDALVDYAAVRHAKPEKILEIGSGRSTQVLARGIAANGRGAITCIDPAPRLSIDDLPVTFERRVLAESDVAFAKGLAANDILFVDSSHILQPGTDVDIEFNIMFPELAPGVLVHVHDIFLPWSYPQHWSGRNWNEASGLAPWVASGAFEVVFATHYMLTANTETMRSVMPAHAPVEPFGGGSFWLRKT